MRRHTRRPTALTRTVGVALAAALLAAPGAASADPSAPAGPAGTAPAGAAPAAARAAGNPGQGVGKDPFADRAWLPAEGVLEGVDESYPATVATGPVGRSKVPAPGSPEARALEAAPAGSTTTPGPVDVPRKPITGYTKSSRVLHPIPEGHGPYEDNAVRPVPFGLIDGEGVRMFRLDDDPTLWNHPIAQAQYALKCLESYRLTQDPQYLDVARANAQRIADRHFELDGAWYFPYDFTFDLYRNGKGVLEAPWSSGMSSGQALSTFVKMYETTGEQQWRDYADKAFKAFTQAPDGKGFFSSWVDGSNRLWLEEYSRYPETDSERVLNGQMWSMYGLFDYWQLNDQDQPVAEDLWRGALYTLEKTGMSFFRQRNDVSLYSMWQGAKAFTYHHHHQYQYVMLWQMSHDSVWVTRAMAYRTDYPWWRDTSGFTVITPKTTTLYKLDDKAPHIKDRPMTVLATKTVSFSRVTGASYDRRGRIRNGPVAIRLSTGAYPGWWVAEGYGTAWSRQLIEWHGYWLYPQVVVTQPKKVAVYSFDAIGRRTGYKFVTLQPGTTYEMNATAIVEGRVAWRMTGPGLDDYWLPHQAGLEVAREPGWL